MSDARLEVARRRHAEARGYLDGLSDLPDLPPGTVVAEGLLREVTDSLGGMLADRDRLEAEVARSLGASPPRPCVAVVVERGDRVLLLRRRGVSWDGHWCFPGGRLERGETLVDCCRRELAEETGMACSDFVGPLAVTEQEAGPVHLIGLVYRAVHAVHEPYNREDDRHDAIGWFPWDRLPGPLMPGAARYVEQRWDFAPKDMEVLAAAVAELDRRAAEVDRLTRLLTDPAAIRAEATRAGLTVELEHWAVKLLALSLAETLGDAPNFATLEVGPLPDEAGGGSFVVTVQRRHGKTPAEVIGELRAEVARLRAVPAGGGDER